MKVTGKRIGNAPAKSSREIIISIWRELGSPAVGASELTEIQNELADAFGEEHSPSPARIARALAQEGAALRHPEIIESDARWRESKIANQVTAFQSLSLLQAGAQLQFNQVAAIVAELEELRHRFENTDDAAALADLRTLAIEARQAAKSHAKDPTLSAAEREAQAEISEWLRVWLETPNLFDQWLELRRSSAAFKEKFSSSD